MSLAELEHQLQIKDAVKPRLNPHIMYFFFMLFIIFVLRVQTNVPKPNITFDEAFIVTRGMDMLGGDFSRGINLLESGSSIFPTLAGLVYSVTGHDGLTAFAAALGAFTAIFIFGTARVLFGTASALYSMLIFGLLGASINLGQLNINQSLAMLLLAISFYFTVDSATLNGRAGYVRIVIAGTSASLAVLTSYLSIFYLPLLILVLVLIHYYHEWPLPHALSIFMFIVPVFIGGYILLNYSYISQLIALNISPAIDLSAAQSRIFRDLVMEYAIVWILGMVGAFLFVVQLRRMEVLSPLALFLLISTSPLLGVLTLALPLFHLVTGSTQNLWQNAILSLLFIIPFAGFAVATLYDALYHARGSLQLRAVSFVIVLAGALWFTNYGLERNFGFVDSIPDVSSAVEYIAAQPLDEETRILAEQAAIYEYYTLAKVSSPELWTDTFFMQYKGLEGVEAMTLAIRERYFDFVILDDYFTASTANPLIEQALEASGYEIALESPEPDRLSSGQEILVRVYSAPEQ